MSFSKPRVQTYTDEKVLQVAERLMEKNPGLGKDSALERATSALGLWRVPEGLMTPSMKNEEAKAKLPGGHR